MKKILGICLLIPLLLLAACNTGGSDGAATEAATVEATEAATPTVEATAAMTDTTGVDETGGLTDTSTLTGTEGMTSTEAMTGTEGITGTEEMTGTEGMTGTEEMTGTEGITDTGSVSGAGVTGATGITGTQGISETAGVQEAPRQLILASDLQDYNIENAQGDSLGSVDDLVLNLENGQVLLVTLEYGGILGIGDKTFPIPLSAFRFDRETADIPLAPAVPGGVVTDTNAITGTDGMTGTGDLTGTMTDTVVVGTRLILDIPEETFENAPGIDEDMNLTDPTTVGEIETFYRALGEDVIGRPIAETNLDELTGRVIKLSDLDGANVNNPDGDGVGEIDDILVDLRAGRVEYFILSFGGFLGIGDDLYAIPMDAFSVIPTSADVENGQPTLVLDVTEEQLQNAPVFTTDQLNSPDWDMEAQDFWLQNR